MFAIRQPDKYSIPLYLLYMSFSFLWALLLTAPLQAKAVRPSLFEHEKYQTDSLRYFLSLKAKAKQTKLSPYSLLKKGQTAQAAGQLAKARTYYELAAGKKGGRKAFLYLASVLLTEKRESYSARQSAKNQALWASLLAYTRAQNDAEEANALDFLGTTLERKGEYQFAIEAYRQVLKREKNAHAAKRLNILLRDHGFRITSHKIDSEAVAPRACLVFSDKLPASLTDLEKYISINASSPTALTKEDNQICIDGLRHGEKLKVQVRQELENIYGEQLYKAATLELYVKDRSPALRFTGKNYVLPATGQQGIPVVSVNLEKAGFTLYRIGDRALVNTLHKPQYDDKLFGRQLTGEEIEKLADTYAKQIWKGTLDIENRLNIDQTTALPVSKILPKREPGVYLLAGRIPDKKTSSWQTRPTQWFIISDIGLTAFKGQDGLNAFVRNLSDARPLHNIKVKLVAKNNEVLGTGKTDASGHVHFAVGLTRGEGALRPALLIASQDNRDYAFLDLLGNGFDLSDRGVSGRKAPGPLDAYMYSERGVYKAGEKVHISALLRNDKNEAVSDLPLTLVMERPDGVEHKRVTLKDQGLGGRSWTLPLLDTAQTGTWKARLYANPKETALAEISFLVEDFVPERLKLALKPEAKQMDPREDLKINVEGNYLFGAPAAGLALEGSLTVARASKPLPGFEGYSFGRADDKPDAVRETLSSLPAADKDGKASLTLALPNLPDTSRLLEARVTVRMVEPSGRAIERMTKVALLPTRKAIGIRPLFSGSVPEGQAARFMIAVMDKNGKAASAGGLKWELKKIIKRYQWYTRDGEWHYEPVIRTQRIANGTLQDDGNKPVTLSRNVDWGEYRLEVASPTDERIFSSYKFEAGWYSADSTEDTPDILEIGLEKATYQAGDTAVLKLKPRSDGLVLITAINEKLLWSTSVAVKKGDNRIEVPVGNWGAGAYIMATHYRPMRIRTRKMPGRAVGIQWLALDKNSRSLKVSLETPTSIRPETKLSVPVSLSGLQNGEKAYVMAALVDEGILNLTRYKAPAPDNWFNAKRQLGLEIRDLYGKLIDGMQARAGKIRSGGDGAVAGMSMKGSPPVQKPVSLFTGIIPVNTEGKAVLEFDVPSFTGNLKLMTVAWSRARTGHAVRSTLVRDPVVMLGTVPRFLSLGDISRFHVNLQNVEAPAGRYTFEVSGNDQVQTGKEGLFSTSFDLAQKAQKNFQIRLQAKAIGDGMVTATLTGPNDFSVTKAYKFTVRPSYPSISRQVMSELKPGGFLTVSDDLLTGMIPGTGRITLSVASKALPDIPGLLSSLDRYPYGCSEQITSRAMPLLYLSSVAEQVGLTQKRDKNIKARLQQAIDKLLSRQGSEGDFGLWRPGNGGLWLSSYVLDFLGRARTEGFEVPQQKLENGLRYLKNTLSYNSDLDKGARKLAYSLYILAKNRKARIGDLRYYADEKLTRFATPLARTHLAAALAMYGDAARSKAVFASALAMLKKRKERKTPFVYGTYGSDLRDSAALLTLVNETGGGMESLPGLSAVMEKLMEEKSRTTTQEQAWLLMAANALLAESKNFRLSVNGLEKNGPLHARLGEDAVMGIKTKVTNTGEADARISITISGAPEVAEPAASNGFDIERLYYTLDGKAVDPHKVKQNTRLVTLIRVHEHERKPGDLIVADYLPAGFEIDNPRLVKSGSSANLNWLPSSAATPIHTTFRDHRFTAAFTLRSGKPDTLTMAYIIRAVAPGTYTHPPAIVEDMYRPERTARTDVDTIIVE